jgi:hypothetical protein
MVAFISASSITLNENVKGAIYQADVLGDLGTVTYELSGADAAFFNFDGSTGLLTLNCGCELRRPTECRPQV